MTHSFDKKYWNEIWDGDRASAMAAGEPNPHLVAEIGDLSPGSALEAGCGAGAEAIWLAAKGWQVTAVDIAADALTRAADRAIGSGAADRVRWVEADLSTWHPETRYDLVTTHYAHPAMPQLEFYDRIASWVAPGGTLFVVGHLHLEHDGPGLGHSDGHGHSDEHGHSDGHGPLDGGPPASASATADGIVGLLDPALWQVDTARETSRTVARPDGREVPLHDVVVRAVRRP